MDSHEQIFGELARHWHTAPQNPARFLPAESSEKDLEEILYYLNAIVESALNQGKIDDRQMARCKANLLHISQLLEGKKAVPYLKAAMLQLSPDNLLQSVLLYSDAAAQSMLEMANRSYIELHAPNALNTISFLYHQLMGDAVYNDRYAGGPLPVNGDAVFCCYDNYFPIYKLIQRYFPQSTICLITNPNQATGKYVYVVSFKNFPDFALKSSGRFLTVLPEFVLKDCRLGKAVIVYNDLAESTHYAPVADSFQQQLKEAGILNSFFLLSGDWANGPMDTNGSILGRIGRFFNLRVTPFNFYIINYFEEAIAASIQEFYPVHSYRGKLNLIKNKTGSIRHFICLNRAVKDYRLYLSYFFYAHNLLDKAYVSQDSYTGPNDITFGYNQNTALWNGLDELKFEKFRQSLPWQIDIDDMKSYVWDAVPMDALNNTFCWIVTETSFGPTLPEASFRLTEKTYKPIAFFMPFIMVGNPFILKKLHESGYQTFSKWWDESYDTAVDPIERMKKITALILKISQLSQLELVSIYEEMQPVLSHNYDLLINSKSAKPAMEAIFSAAVPI
jgi:hypothetical protein